MQAVALGGFLFNLPCVPVEWFLWVYTFCAAGSVGLSVSCFVHRETSGR